MLSKWKTFAGPFNSARKLPNTPEAAVFTCRFDWIQVAAHTPKKWIAFLIPSQLPHSDYQRFGRPRGWAREKYAAWPSWWTVGQVNSWHEVSLIHAQLVFQNCSLQFAICVAPKMVVFVKEVELSSVGMQDFVPCPVTAWTQNVVSTDDCQKLWKMVFALLVFHTLHVSAAIVKLICFLNLTKGAFMTIQVSGAI